MKKTYNSFGISALIIICCIINPEFSLPAYSQDLGHITCMAVNQDFVFTGTTKSGVLLSKDEGKNWKAVNKGLDNLHVISLAVDNERVYAGTSKGIYLTTNNGSSWENIKNNFGEGSINKIEIYEHNIVVGTRGGGGIHISSGIGLNWKAINNGFDNYISVDAIACDEKNIYAGIWNEGIFISDNYGENWKQIKKISEKTDINGIKVSGSTIYILTSSGIFESQDNGNNWIEINNGLIDLNINDLIVENNRLYAATKSGIFMSDIPVKEWVPYNIGIINLDIKTVAAAGNNLIAGGWDGNILISENKTGIWKPVFVKKDSSIVYESPVIPLEKKKSNKLKFSNVLREFGLGLGLGLGVPLGIGAIVFGLGSSLWGNHQGDSGTDPSKAAAIILVLGHIAGSISGVIVEGEKEDGLGSVTMGVLGGLIGEAGSLALYIKLRDKSTGAKIGFAAFYLLAAPIFATLGYNLFRTTLKEDSGNSFLLNYSNRKFSFAGPKLFFTSDTKTKQLITNINVFHMSF